MSIKLVENEEQGAIKKLEKYVQEKQKGIDGFVSFIDLSYENDSNQINECLIEEEQGEIKNASFYKGTKDTGLIELDVVEQTQKSFLKESVNFAFDMLHANTVTVFSKQPSRELESLGFESLGEHQGRMTYIKEQVIEEKIGRVK